MLRGYALDEPLSIKQIWAALIKKLIKYLFSP